MNYPDINKLEEFLNKCEDALLKEENQQSIIYPKKIIEEWKADKLKEENDRLLKEISGSACVYIIFIKKKNKKKYELIYIGQTNPEYARTRITNHLIKKNKNTGSKLEKVKSHIREKGEIKISWIEINPISLRHYIEEELIKRHKTDLTWNQRGK